MTLVFISVMAFLSAFAKHADRLVYTVLFLYAFLFVLADKLTYAILNVDYKTSIFIAMSFAFTAQILISSDNSKLSIKHSTLLLLAITIHFMQLIDIITLSSIVYDNYESYILAITLLQLAASYESLHYAVINAPQRILLLLRRGNIYCSFWGAALCEYFKRESRT